MRNATATARPLILFADSDSPRVTLVYSAVERLSTALAVAGILSNCYIARRELAEKLTAAIFDGIDSGDALAVATLTDYAEFRVANVARA